MATQVVGGDRLKPSVQTGPVDATALCRLIDHTLLRPEATAGDVDATVGVARRFQTASVCVNPAWVSRVAASLTDSGVPTCSVVAFPFGIQVLEAATAEAEAALDGGATEIDVVAPLHLIAERDWSAFERDLAGFRSAIGTRAIIKVILESAAWDDDQVARSARIAVATGADYVKTSTGFHPSGGASLHAVRLLAGVAAGVAGVKASGGIRSLATALAMLDAGATRLGCSATETIVTELGAQPAS